MILFLLLNISEDDIFAIVENLNLNKYRGWDNISIKMRKLSEKSIVHLLNSFLKPPYKVENCLIFRKYLK